MRQSTTPTATDAATISSAADIIHQEPPTLDSPGIISATSGQGDSAPATVPGDQQQDTPGRRTRRKSTTSSAVKNSYNNRVYDRIEIRIPKGQRQQLQDAANAAGLSTSAYIINAINATAGHEIITPLATNPYI